MGLMVSERIFIVFPPIIDLWDIYVAMATRVPIQPFPQPDDALHEI